MDSEIETLMIDVRASTDGFAADIGRMREQFDTTLVDGFAKAGNVLETSLLGAVRRGSLGFDDLKRTALRALDEIAASALRSGIASLGGAFSGGLGGIVGGLLGLPGRATGGNVSPGSAYVVGERGPELFVPTSAGRIDNGSGMGGGRDVRVSINLAAQPGSSSAQSLARSSRQVASAVRRALASY